MNISGALHVQTFTLSVTSVKILLDNIYMYQKLASGTFIHSECATEIMCSKEYSGEQLSCSE